MLEAGIASLGMCQALLTSGQHFPVLLCHPRTSGVEQSDASTAAQSSVPNPACLPLLKVVELLAEDLEGDGLVAEGVLLDDLHGLDQSCAGRVVLMEQVTCQHSGEVQ